MLGFTSTSQACLLLPPYWVWSAPCVAALTRRPRLPRQSSVLHVRQSHTLLIFTFSRHYKNRLHIPGSLSFSILFFFNTCLSFLLWVPGNYESSSKHRNIATLILIFSMSYFYFPCPWLSISVFSLFFYQILPQKLCRKRYCRVWVNVDTCIDAVSVKAGAHRCTFQWVFTRYMNWIELEHIYLHVFISVCIENLSSVLMNKQITQTFSSWLQEFFFNYKKEL